ncbi:MAG: hypothetical protein FWH15_09495 [Betaproteobacteria bacterium]|nr:hypothetical protein [Betaproteobacteria bacterium]
MTTDKEIFQLLDDGARERIRAALLQAYKDGVLRFTELLKESSSPDKREFP